MKAYNSVTLGSISKYSTSSVRGYSKGVVGALEQLSERIDLEHECKNLRFREELSTTERVILALPWLSEKLTWNEIVQVVTVTELVDSWRVGKRKEETLADVTFLCGKSGVEDFAVSITEFGGVETSTCAVKLELESEKRIKSVTERIKAMKKELRISKARVRVEKRLSEMAVVPKRSSL